MRPYRLGITVGRFQPFHNGHRMVIDKALELCEKVGVFIGSSQESGTNKNPFSYELRKEIIKRIYGESVYVYPLPDIGAGNNSVWGDYVLECVFERFGEYPDLLISGKEERRASWFDGAKGASAAELYIPKTVDISASRIRELFLNGEYESWKKYSDERIWELFPEMRKAVLKSYGNTGSASL